MSNFDAQFLTMSNTKIYFAGCGCYYNIKYDHITHDSGPGSNRTCPHRFSDNEQLIDQLDPALIAKTRAEFDNFMKTNTTLNELIGLIQHALDNNIPFTQIPARFASFLQHAEIPKTYNRGLGGWNLFFDLRDRSICYLVSHESHLPKSYINYGFKYC